MFDTYVVGHGRSYPSTVHHHEHRAPTDESVKLLKEMEKAAEDKLVASFPLKSNSFEGHVTVGSDPIRGAYTARCIFVINGQRLTATSTADFAEAAMDSSLLYQRLHEEVSKVIAAEMLAELLKGHPIL